MIILFVICIIELAAIIVLIKKNLAMRVQIRSCNRVISDLLHSNDEIRKSTDEAKKTIQKLFNDHKSANDSFEKTKQELSAYIVELESKNVELKKKIIKTEKPSRTTKIKQGAKK